MGFIEVRDRDFSGTDVAFHRVGNNWDACLLHCKHNRQCQYVIHNLSWEGGMCVLKNNLGNKGPHGRDTYVAGLRAAVAVKRLTPEQVNWQWSMGEGSIAGEIIRIPSGDSRFPPRESMAHAENGKGNIFLCQLACLQEGRCTHVVYDSERCWLMDARGSRTTTITGPSPLKTAINMAVWNDFDK
jgi:hypothetical protein